MEQSHVPVKKYIRAAELILRGHCKGEFAFDEKGRWAGEVTDPKLVRFCMIGAVNKASGRFVAEMLPNREADVFKSALGRNRIQYDISNWNDNPARTPEEVADLLVAIAYNPKGFDTPLQKR